MESATACIAAGSEVPVSSSSSYVMRPGPPAAELTEDVAFGKYLVGQLLDRIEQAGESLNAAGRPSVAVSATDADYTDRVRAAAERAYSGNQWT